MNYAQIAGQLLDKVRASRPLLHHITNYVVMNDNANVALHIGAAPVMAHALEEMAEMAGIASTLIVNIGTLNQEWIVAMEAAMTKAGQRQIPLLLDPVGAGATSLRTQTSLRFLQQYRVTMLKGNLGEISVLAGLDGKVRGVDSESGAEPSLAAQKGAERFGIPVAVTGKEDFVSDGKRTLRISNGSHWLGTITGSGCSAATVMGAFLAVEKDAVLAAASALSAYSVASEIAEERQPEGPASFKVAFFDALYRLTPQMVTERANIQEV